MRFFNSLRNTSLVLIWVAFLAHGVFATAQRPNIIFIEGKEYDLCDDPMEPYFKKFPERLPKADGRWSNLWRGYIATFEFEDGLLRLNNIEVYRPAAMPDNKGRSGFQSVLSEAVPGGKKLMIDWVTGLLVIQIPPYRQLDYDEYDCTLQTENYMVLELDSGRFVRSKRFDGFEKWKAFREKQFNAFRRSEDYKAIVKQMRENGRREDTIDPVISDYILWYSKKILVE